MYKNLIEADSNLFLGTYKRLPLDIDYGKGVYLYSKDGDKYLDFFSGLAVNALGFAHPEIIKAVTNQISRFAHVSNSYLTDVQAELAEMLLKYSGMDKLFFSNSGAESIEAAIKLLRMHFGPDKNIFSLTDSFHGRTYGALSITARPKYQKGFEPLLPNIGTVQFNDTNDLRNKVNENTAAVFLEFFQGEGGINEVSKEFSDELKDLRDKFGFAIVADEIQTGIGRTGKPFGYNWFLQPDIVVCAKAIGGGLPLGAILTNDKFSRVFTQGKHGTTFGGNPVSCAAGIVVLKEVFEKGLIDSIVTNGTYFKNLLLSLKNELPEKIKEVRGQGYMLGVELNFPGESIVNALFEKKILSNCTNDVVIRILPPLIAGKQEIDFYFMSLREVIKKY